MTLRGLAAAAAALATGAVLAWAAGLGGLWQRLDMAVYGRVSLAAAPQPDPRLHLVDVAYVGEAPGGVPAFRSRAAQALQALARLDPAPRLVLLDIWIAADPPDGVDALAAAVAALQQRGTRVLGAVEPKDRQGRLTADFMRQHAARLYTDVLDGFGHTQLQSAAGVLWIDCRLALPGAVGTTWLPALPALAAPGGCGDGAVVIPLGDDAAWRPQIHRPDAAGSGLQPPLPARGGAETVIVGSLAADSDNLLARPGPLLLAWALTDFGRGRESAARQPLNHPAAAPVLAALTLLATLVAYWLGFRVARTRLAPARWPLLAALLVLLAWAAAAALLLATGALVGLDGGPVVPVALPLAAGLAAALWAWRGARRWIDDEQVRTNLADAREERAIACDVFISYAHEPPEHKAWVKQALAGPLAALRHPDGTPYRVFFDESTIRVGRQWKAEIELTLLGTRCMVAVYSDRYFERPYCREEFELADQLRIEGRLRLLPVARGAATIPERYGRKLQYIDASGEAPFIDALCAQVRAAVDGDDGR